MGEGCHRQSTVAVVFKGRIEYRRSEHGSIIFVAYSLPISVVTRRSNDSGNFQRRVQNPEDKN